MLSLLWAAQVDNVNYSYMVLPRKPATSVLLVGDAYYSVLAAVRALRQAGYTPWLAVGEPGTYAARSRATAGTVLVPNPTFDREGFVRELAAAASRLSVAAVLPSAESHLFSLYRSALLMA